MDPKSAQREMPKYKCHKVVHALKIAAILRDERTGTALITPGEEGYAEFAVPAPYMQKHQPLVGGYYVVYEDGYESFSPAKAFEEGYARI